MFVRPRFGPLPTKIVLTLCIVYEKQLENDQNPKILPYLAIIFNFMLTSSQVISRPLKVVMKVIFKSRMAGKKLFIWILDFKKIVFVLIPMAHI